MVNEILGSNIRKNRLNLNWTQEKLAEMLCVSHQVISKWENGVAAPDITALCAMAGLFGVSMDTLCGIGASQTDGLIGEMERLAAQHENRYDMLYAKWLEMENRIMLCPTNDKLLFAALTYLRAAHDRVETDTQKDQINDAIQRVSQRILDFSRNDSYRSYANYNLAVYYDEQVYVGRGNAEDLANAQKAKYHKELVFYRDMPKSFYRTLGTASVQEEAAAIEENLKEMTSAAIGACKNLLRRYRHFFPDEAEKIKTCEEVYALLLEAERKCPAFK
jgi:transcriptional regulator with XRE-family HTH domain